MTFAGEFLGLPGLRGYWPMSAFDSSGNAIDQSGNGRTLTYNGGGTGPLYNYHASGGPYLDFDGTGDYMSRADEAGLDILGTESYVASAVRGLTVGGWFWFDTAGSQMALLGKYNITGNQRAYVLNKPATDKVTFTVSVDGTATVVVTSTTTLSATAWYFAVGRFIPSTETNVFLQGADDASNTTSIPASIVNSTATFEIGSFNAGGTALLNGRGGMCFACAMALSDTAISNIYQGTRGFYGV